MFLIVDILQVSGQTTWL